MIQISERFLLICSICAINLLVISKTKYHTEAWFEFKHCWVKDSEIIQLTSYYKFQHCWVNDSETTHKSAHREKLVVAKNHYSQLKHWQGTAMCATIWLTTEGTLGLKSYSYQNMKICLSDRILNKLKHVEYINVKKNRLSITTSLLMYRNIIK